jgi:hypothetical protein
VNGSTEFAEDDGGIRGSDWDLPATLVANLVASFFANFVAILEVVVKISRCLHRRSTGFHFRAGNF